MQERSLTLSQAGRISLFYFGLTGRITIVLLFTCISLWLSGKKFCDETMIYSPFYLIDWLQAHEWVLGTISATIYLGPANLTSILMIFHSLSFGDFRVAAVQDSLELQSSRLLHDQNSPLSRWREWLAKLFS